MTPNPITLAIAVVLVGLGVLAILGGLLALGAALIALAIVILAALKMARQWERAIVLRAGRFRGVNGPGLFVIVPILDTVAAVIDTRLRTTQFVAEQTLTKDTVPVDVDAIIFWIVMDAQRAALEVVNYGEADRLGGANLAARNDRRQRTCDAAIEPQGDGRRAARHDRRARPRNGESTSDRSKSATSGSR